MTRARNREPLMIRRPSIEGWEGIEYLEDDPLAASWIARRSGSDQLGVLELWSIGHPEESRALRREMYALERFEHPSFARVLGSGLLEGRPWRVIEWVGGTALRSWVRDTWPAPPLHQAEALRALLTGFATLCSPLAWLAGEGEPHGDLDPSHITVRGQGEFVITRFDFRARCAREAARDLPPAPEERAGFRSPERLRGESVDTRGDLYALGAMLYWSLTGRTPYATVAEAAEGSGSPPPPSAASPGLARDLDDLVMSLIARSPRGRPSDARVIAATLVRLGARAPRLEPPPRARLLPASPDGPAPDDILDPLGVALWIAPVLGRLSVPAAFAQAVHRATEGRVFAVGEWLRTAVALGVLELDDMGEWRLQGHDGLPEDPSAWERVPLPSGAREVTSRRLRALSSSARALLQDAALLGDAFDDEVWFAVSDRPVEDSERIARELRRREVIRRISPGRSGFTHETLHEAVTQILPPKRRREMHARVARAHERMAPERAVTIAEHWRDAKEPERARAWFERAAANAAAEGDEAAATVLRERAKRGR